MAYPKPLSQKTIDKMFSTWDKQTVETLHTYYKAFSDLYGIIQKMPGRYSRNSIRRSTKKNFWNSRK